MKKLIIRKKQWRYGSISIVLIALTIAVAVLGNSLVSTLSDRFGWYVNMNNYGTFDVTDGCFDVVAKVFDAFKDEQGNRKKVSVIFCNTEEGVVTDSVGNYIHATIEELSDRFDNIEVVYHDIWTNPDSVRAYRTSYNPVSGKETETSLKSTNVIVTCGDYHRVYEQTEFFVFEDGDTSSVIGYDGERAFAAAFLHAVDPETHFVCLTSNHGEAFYDYELLYFLDNAGYTIYYMDLFNDTIPANCDLIISFNPNTDLIHDDVAGKSEVDVINQFLSVDGHSFFVFIENGTPALPNFESLMNAWGIASAYNNGYRYMLKDTTRTLTSDGYTIYGNVADNQTAKSMLDAMEKSPVFKDATAFTVASTGYTAKGNGTYTSASRTLIPVYQSSKSAEAWVNGNAVDSGEMHMMMLTEQQNTVGKSYFVALSSTDFCTENYLQSAVYGNADLLNMVLTYTGKTQTLAGLNYIPFQSTDVSSVTTRQMVAWTLCLTLIPTAILTTACIVVMRRRKNA